MPTPRKGFTYVTPGAPPDFPATMNAALDEVDAAVGGLDETVTTALPALVRKDAPGLPTVEPHDDYLFAVTDADGNLTDAAVRASDGQVPDFVLERWRARLGGAPAGGGTTTAEARQYVDARYTPGADVYPVETDMTQWAGWGSSTMNGLQWRIRDAATAAGSTYYDGSQSGETAENIMARMGARPALLTFPGNTVPGTGAVTVTASNMAIPNGLKTFSGYVGAPDGVLGELSYSAGTLTFTRTGTGDPVPVAPDAPFYPYSGPLHRADFTVLNIGKNNLVGTAGADDTVIGLTWTAFQWLAPLRKRVVVPGHFVNTDTTPGSTTHAQVLKVNADYRRRYGPVYFDMQGYVCGSQIWTDAGLTPTADDLTAQAEGRKAPSLSSDAAHLNTAARDATSRAIVAHAAGLGWI